MQNDVKPKITSERSIADWTSSAGAAAEIKMAMACC